MGLITSHADVPTSPVEGPGTLDPASLAKKFEDRIYDMLYKEHRHIEGFCKSKRGLISWKLGEVEKTIKAQEQTEKENLEREQSDRARDLPSLETQLGDHGSLADYFSTSRKLDKELSEAGKGIKTFSKYVSNARTGFENLIRAYETQANSPNLNNLFKENVMNGAEFVGNACDPVATLQNTHTRLRKSLDQQKSSRLGSNALSSTLSQDGRGSTNRLQVTILDRVETGSTTNTVSTEEGGSSGFGARAEQSSWTVTDSDHSHISDKTSSQDVPYAQARRSASRASRSRRRSRSKRRESSTEAPDHRSDSGEQNEAGISRKTPAHSTCTASRRWIDRALGSLSPTIMKTRKLDEEAPLISDESLLNNRPHVTREPSDTTRDIHYATFSNVNSTPDTLSILHVRHDWQLQHAIIFICSLAALLLLPSIYLSATKRGRQSTAIDMPIITGMVGSLVAVSLGLACTMMRRARVSAAWRTLAVAAAVIICAVNVVLACVMIDEYE